MSASQHRAKKQAVPEYRARRRLHIRMVGVRGLWRVHGRYLEALEFDGRMRGANLKCRFPRADRMTDDRLDEETERLIMELAGTEWGGDIKGAIERLRSRIRELCEEAGGAAVDKAREMDANV